MTLDRWERRAEIPLTLLALAFLVAYVWPILDPRLDRELRTFFELVSWAVWAVFAFDLVVRVALAPQRRTYLVRHWYDVALVVLPVLRPLRLLRLVALLRILDRTAANTLAGRVLIYVVSGAVSCTGLGAVAVLGVERDAPGANITTFGDALWWACATVTTVGYGDRYPVTVSGRCIAVVLMVIGISLVGAVTASIASWILAHSRGDELPGMESNHRR